MSGHDATPVQANIGGLAVMITPLLLWGALINGFPLIFPDSGTYLGIAYGPEYAIDRSSVYGLLLKPFIRPLPGSAGLWLAITAQALLIAIVLAAAMRAMAPAARRPLMWLLPVILLTSLPWHSGQFMPDAFTGPLILVAWLAARRDPTEDGAASLWLAAVVLALTHYTHLVLLIAAAGTAIGAQIAVGLPIRAAARRSAAAGAALLLAISVLVVANGAVLGRWTLSPAGPMFLFARLNEDGLIPAWLDRHCGRDAPADLCRERKQIVTNSQALLWGDADSFIGRHISQPGSDAERWRWMNILADANRGAIKEQPVAFAGTSLEGAARQFIHFAALDDECPAGCRSVAAGIGYTLAKYRPETVADLHGSMQVRDTIPKALLRDITTPIAALALLLTPCALLMAWRRRDPVALSLMATIIVALFVNAAMAGALSDVHDRYQSRVIWLAPFALLLVGLRWWSGAGPRETR